MCKLDFFRHMLDNFGLTLLLMLATMHIDDSGNRRSNKVMHKK